MPSPRQPRAPVQPKAELPREQNPDPDIVVTGTIQPERKLDAGLAITTVTLDRIRELAPNNTARSEEHTSELQSLMRISYAVFCLKKKITHQDTKTSTNQTKNNINKCER